MSEKLQQQNNKCDDKTQLLDVTSLYNASKEGKFNLVAELLEKHGAEIKTRSEACLDDYEHEENTLNNALCLAAEEGHFEVVKLLVNHGAEAIAVDMNYLMGLEGKGVGRTINFLMDNGGQIDPPEHYWS